METVLSIFKKILLIALAGVAQWIESWPANRSVAGLIPCQGTCLGCSPGPQLGAHGRPPVDVSLPLFCERETLMACLLHRPQPDQTRTPGACPAQDSSQ